MKINKFPTGPVHAKKTLIYKLNYAIIKTEGCVCGGPMRLFPRDDSFFDLFEEQAKIIYDCMPLLLEIEMAKIIDALWAVRASELEGRCDAATGTIRGKLHKAFITPIDREDIYKLSGEIDDVMDLLEDVVIRIVDNELTPNQDLKKFLEIVRLSITRLRDGILGLRAQPKNIDEFSENRTKMKQCENDADKLIRKIRRENGTISVSNVLGKNGVYPVSIDALQPVLDAIRQQGIKLEIAELMESAVDACMKVYDTLGNIYAKYA